MGIPDITIDLGIPNVNIDMETPNIDVNLANTNLTNNNLTNIDLININDDFNNLTIKQDEVNNFINKVDNNIKYLMKFYQEVEKSFVDTRNIKNDKTLY
ncbi:MAG: hypothetical protein IKP65_04245 [Alphaproteobacteria bacterium]|nr:hypothetical protein [Alphaproteobacteria bacterium]